MLKFTEEHEWLKVEGDVATVGITAHAAEQLGDLVFVELPEVGAGFAKGDEAGTYYGYLSFITSGEWAMAVEFRSDSTRKLERVDWIQGVLPERPLGQ